MSSGPLVSVITIFFNGERFIEEAVESVLAQVYDNWELMLVDDGSTDASTTTAMRYAARYPNQVRYLDHRGHVNRGSSTTRNFGLKHVKGQYVAFLDVDDVWLPHKLERQVAILESRPEAGMVFGATEYWLSWTGHPEDLTRDYVPDLGVETNRIFEPQALMVSLYPLGRGTAPCPSDLLIRRSVIDDVGGCEDDFRGVYQLYEDQVLLAKIYARHSVFVSSECWDRYRIHSDSCMSVVAQGGHYHRVRLFFLNWLEAYLSALGFSHSRAWTALEEALRPYRDPLAADRSRWWLRTVGGNVATLTFPSGTPDTLRVEINRFEAKKNFDIQLNQSNFRAELNGRYLLSFKARADTPRAVNVGFAQAHDPWQSLGLYHEIVFPSEWSEFREEFVATAADDNARFFLDLGSSDVSIDLADVSLRSMSDDRVVEPDLLLAQPAAGNRSLLNLATDVSLNLDPSPQVTTRPSAVGNLLPRQVTPVSSDWGWDRGLPIDRYYIDRFLSGFMDDIEGRVLEVGDDRYTRRFGGERVTASDILNVTGGDARATIIADLAKADHIASNTFDCIVVTQTLQFIFDLQAAVTTLSRILKPGGVVLATFPGITRQRQDDPAGSWLWSLTGASARQLFRSMFLPADVRVQSYGNVLAAVSFLHGLAAEELTQDELDYFDPDYALLIGVRAVKSASETAR